MKIVNSKNQDLHKKNNVKQIITQKFTQKDSFLTKPLSRYEVIQFVSIY